MAETVAASTAGSCHRPWYRLHLSTWLVVLLGLIVGVLLIVPGEDGWYPNFYSLIRGPSVVHGWPIPYLWRTPLFWWQTGKAKPTYAWDIADSVKAFSPFALALDIGIVALGIGLVAAAWEWRWRRMPRFQFSVRALFLFITLVAIALGVWGVVRRADQEWRGHFDAVKGDSTSHGRAIVPRFPLWVRILVGDERLIQLGINKPGETWINWNRSIHERVEYLAGRFPEEIWIDVRQRPGEHDVDALAEQRSVENLELEDASDRILERVCMLPRLHRLWISTDRDHAISDAGVAHVAQIPNLELILINDAHRISQRGLAGLLNSTTLKSLTLWGARLTHEDMEKIASLKELRELEINGSAVGDDAIVQLARNNSIESLFFEETLVTDDALAQLGKMPNLKYLDVTQSAVTDAGVAALRQARPDLDILYESEAGDLAGPKTKIADVASGKTTRLVVAGLKIRDWHLSELGTLTTIDSLALNAHHLTDVTMARVQSLQKLKELDLTGSRITPHGLENLTKLTNLRRLILDAPQFDEQSIEILKKLPMLRSVSIKHILDATDLKRFAERLKRTSANGQRFEVHLDPPL
jgi:hypothetical protein